MRGAGEGHGKHQPRRCCAALALAALYGYCPASQTRFPTLLPNPASQPRQAFYTATLAQMEQEKETAVAKKAVAKQQKKSGKGQVAPEVPEPSAPPSPAPEPAEATPVTVSWSVCLSVCLSVAFCEDAYLHHRYYHRHYHRRRHLHHGRRHHRHRCRHALATTTTTAATIAVALFAACVVIHAPSAPITPSNLPTNIGTMQRLLELGGPTTNDQRTPSLKTGSPLKQAFDEMGVT